MKTMKKFVYLLVCSITLTVACKKENGSLPGENTTANEKNVVLEKLKSYGIPEKLIVEQGDYYVVDGDLAFHKTKTDLKALEAYFAKPKEDEVVNLNRVDEIAQAHTTNLITNDVDAISMRVNLYDRVPANGLPYSWYYAILEAAGHWNAVTDTRVNIADYDYIGAGTADITLMNDVSAPLPSGVVARAEFPQSGNPGWRIRVSEVYNYFSHAEKVYVIVHELGHCLGLRHTNWEANNEGQAGIGAIHIPGTPSNDPNSVMNSTGVVGWAGFSAYDIIAAQYLYPWSNPINKWITFPDNKYPDNVINMADDQSLYVTWNTSLHASSTVTFKMYQNDVLTGTLATGVPNTGSASFTPLQVYAALGWPTLYTVGNVRIELVSDSNPAVKDRTGYLVFRLNS